MEENFEENGNSEMKQWIQDNLRIIISILIVVAIAAGIYSYSKRAEAPLAKNSDQAAENMSDEEISAILENNDEPEIIEKKNEEAPVLSQETEQSFIEVAAKGEGRTHLARRALANYLEKNSDSSLSPEHKIYIEDYLRKNVAGKGSLLKGNSVEFSKSLIQDAISKSKNLNENQLKNLHKYAVRVPSLT